MTDVLLEMLRKSIGIIGYRNHSKKLLQILNKDSQIKKILVYCYKDEIFLKLKKKIKQIKKSYILIN